MPKNKHGETWSLSKVYMPMRSNMGRCISRRVEGRSQNSSPTRLLSTSHRHHSRELHQPSFKDRYANLVNFFFVRHGDISPMRCRHPTCDSARARVRHSRLHLKQHLVYAVSQVRLDPLSRHTAWSRPGSWASGLGRCLSLNTPRVSTLRAVAVSPNLIRGTVNLPVTARRPFELFKRRPIRP